MSQARKIYEFLARTPNRNADKALLSGLRLTEPPYQEALLETILERGSAEATAELIGAYHRYPLEWQRIMHTRADSLYSGLRRVGSSPVSQSRLNVLTIIRRTSYRRMADVIVAMLRDSNKQIVQLAGTVLLETARQSNQDKPNDIAPEPQAEPGRNQNERQIVYTALRRAVSQYNKQHHQEDVILAAMCFAPAHWEYFWQGFLEPYNAVGQCVRQILSGFRGPELARFYLGALQNSYLRPTAVRAIAQNGRNDFLLALARRLRREESEEAIARGLAMIHNPSWLNAETLALADFEPDDQVVLIQFITALGVEQGRIIKYLCSVVQDVDEPAARQAVEIFAALPGPMMIEPMSRILVSRHERAAQTALAELIKANPPEELSQLMAEQLNSPHQEVRRIAQNYYRKIAFSSYWRNFEKLPHEQQIAAGRAVCKIDPRAFERLCDYAQTGNSTEQLQAIMIVRLLGMGQKCWKILRKMAENLDRKVRSCAVAALGEAGENENKAVRECLLNGLDDQDERVRANAVEALQQQNDSRTTEKIIPLAKSPDNRVRANAIKVLLNWKVASARKMVEEMLNDTRPAHRRSAAWVLRDMVMPDVQQHLKTSEKSHDGTTVTVL
ncbi:MAG: HEAT repeat domain-containing protein [Sedimentisphaerales bacterium]|nr:HEAT repeat domain-containing protein [Sedimentisphaerales bacterium]